MQAVWWIVFAVSVAAYAVLAAVLLPKVFFKPFSAVSRPRGRGLRNFKEENGRSIVYEPQPEYLKYISQYILSHRDGKKAFMCKLNDSIAYIDYDVVVFNSKGKAFDIINVKENIKRAGFGRVIELPDKTDCVTLVVNAADDIKIDNRKSMAAKKRNIALFALCAALATVVEIFFAKLCLSAIYADVFIQDFMTSGASILLTLAMAVFAAAIDLVAVVVYVRLKTEKERKRGRVEEA